MRLYLDHELRQDSCGVQVISAWLLEGGSTAGFTRTINELARQDGSVASIVHGLVDISVLLAHMSALMLGTTASALVGGLLDMYADLEADDVADGSDERGSDRAGHSTDA